MSGGELKRARAAGVPADKIMFSGIGKTAAELALALDEGILCVNVESEPELELLSAIAASKGRTANVSVRVNPDVDAKTHAKIATGKAENKFGIPISRAREVYAKAAKLPGLRVAGVDMHIGSQITELSPFDDAFALLSDFVRSCAPTATPSRTSISAAGWAFRIARTTIRRPIPPPMPRWSSARRAASTAS